MKLYTLTSLLFLLQLSVGCFAQQPDCIFDITEKQIPGSDTYVFYADKNDDKYKKVPDFNLKTDLSSIIIKKPPIKELIRIEKEIFSKEELKGTGRILVIFKIHIPSGKIVAVSFSTKNRDIDVNKLRLYNQRIKNEIVFDITLKAELITEGYDRISYRLFFSSY